KQKRTNARRRAGMIPLSFTRIRPVVEQGRVAASGGETMTIEQALAVAVRHHQRGELPQAETIYRKILAAQPRNADAMQLLGVLAHQIGRNDAALDLIGRAIVIA